MRPVLNLDGAPGLEWGLGFSWRYVLVALLALMLSAEAWATYPIYFQDYVLHLPSKNCSISREMARAIDDFADDGEAYIKAMPHWHDGKAVRAQLRRADQSWDNELWDLEPGKPPLDGKSGKFMVILHPQDEAALRTLQQAFSTGIALNHLNNDGDVAFITVYGER